MTDAHELNPYNHLATVLDGAHQDDAAPVIQHRGQSLTRLNSRRNLWKLVTEDGTVETFDADKFTSTTQLGVFLDQRLRLVGVEVPLPEGVDVDDDQESNPHAFGPTGFQ